MKRIDPKTPPSIESVLLHGLNNLGKTHLLASMLSAERERGKCVYIGVEGEPYATLFAAELDGVELIEISTVDEIPALVKEIGRVHAIALDSVQRLGEIAGVKVTGGAYIVGAKEDHGRDWAKLKFEIFKALELFKRTSDLFVAVSPTRLHENNITKAVRAVPDVSGVGETLVGRFNFVGYLEAQTVSPTVVKRLVNFQPRVDAVTRCNAKKGITKPTAVSDGLGCWGPIRSTLESAIRGD